MQDDIRRFGKKDIILIAVIIAASVIAAFIAFTTSHEGSTVVITVSGEEYGRYPIDTDRVITVDTDSGINEITINNGEAYVSYADCPQGICAHHKPVSRSGESIICVPHEVVISIESEDSEGGYDAVSG